MAIARSLRSTGITPLHHFPHGPCASARPTSRCSLAGARSGSAWSLNRLSAHRARGAQMSFVGWPFSKNSRFSGRCRPRAIDPPLLGRDADIRLRCFDLRSFKADAHTVIDSAQNAQRLRPVRAISPHDRYIFQFEAVTPPYYRECRPSPRPFQAPLQSSPR
jgi:hypothetical protein